MQKAVGKEGPARVAVLVDVAALGRSEVADLERVDKNAVELVHVIVHEAEVIVVGWFDFGSDVVLLRVEWVDGVALALVVEPGLEAEIGQLVEVAPGEKIVVEPGAEVGYTLEAGFALEHVMGIADIVAHLVVGRDSTVDKIAGKGHIQHTADSIADTVVGTIVQKLPQQVEPGN